MIKKKLTKLTKSGRKTNNITTDQKEIIIKRNQPLLNYFSN